MSKVSNRLVWTILAIALASLTLSACTHRVAMLGSCTKSTDKNKPVVCVDNDTLTVDPKIIEVHRRKWLGFKSVKIEWKTQKQANLQVKVTKDGCVEENSIVCNGTGHCQARTLKSGGLLDCTYEVTVDGVMADPHIIVDDCCP